MKKLHKRIAVIMSKPYKGVNSQLLEGILKQAYSKGYNVYVFLMTDRIELSDIFNSEANLLNAINFDLFDGVIYLPVCFGTAEFQDIIEDHLRKHCRKPVVVVGKQVEGFEYVWKDDKREFSFIVQHMIHVHGCRRIACLTGHKGSLVSEERLAGYLEAMKLSGLTVHDDDVIYGDFWVDSGENYGRKLLENIDDMPDAVVCANDVMAIHLCKTLIAGGVRVPEDIRISGYDGTWDAQFNDPGISTYISDYKKLGGECVCRILKLITGEDTECIMRHSEKYLSNQSCGCMMPQLDKSTANMFGNLYVEDLDERYLDNHPQSYLTACQNLDEFVNALFKLTYTFFDTKHFDSERFCLCLCDDWFGTNTENGDVIYRTEGYSEKMIGIDITKLPTPFPQRQIMPNSFWNPERPSATFISAVHFRGICYGYALFQRKGLTGTVTPQFSKFCQDIGISLSFMNTYSRMKSLAHMAYLSDIRDALTGVYRFTMLKRLWSQYNEYAMNNDSLVSIAGVSIYNARNIHETYGQSEMDSACSVLASILQSCCRNGQSCIRSDGNEFLLLGTKKPDTNAIEQIKSDIITQIENHNQSSGNQYSIMITFAELSRKPYEYEEPDQVYSELKELMKEEEKRTHNKSERMYYSALVALRKDIFEHPEYEWSLQICSNRLGMSLSHFQRLYHNVFGFTCTLDIQKSRLDKAKKLLIETDYTLQDIAAECGYEYVSFMRTFKKQFGMTPTEYRHNTTA